ncbi:MAG: hypothetical protein COA32_06450 [Fluviicola sp.]|nr:MAG: hypothetical protein COA32_06450 [Fluviicola sp.]
MEDDFTIDDYKEMYQDMKDTAEYFIVEGKKFNHSGLISAANRALTIYEKAIFVTDLLDAEAHYNDIAAELYECNEFYGNTTGYKCFTVFHCKKKYPT